MKKKLTLSVSPNTKEKLEQQATKQGYNSISAFLDAIATEQLTTINSSLLEQIRKI